MKPTIYPFYLANRPVQSKEQLQVTDKYSGEVAYLASLANRSDIDRGIEAAVNAVTPMRRLAPYIRQGILNHCAERFREKAEDLAISLCTEAGKPIKDARGEVTRLIDTFRIAAEESVRIEGDVLNLETTERAKGYRGFVKSVPIGVCSFISPFNFPLNLVAHKIAPAIAAGCPFILKPASRTPIGALQIAEILAETDLPEGAFSILPCNRNEADAFTTDERLKLLSFTGSSEVGWELKKKAGKKKVVLELGGNAACIVDQDTSLSDAVDRIVIGAFYQSGQSCIGVQRILVHAAIYDEFKKKLLEKTKSLKIGDPKDQETFVGPLIAEAEAGRLMEWINSAVKAGGRVLCGGKRQGSVLEPTILEKVPADEPLCSEEAFGPVAVLSKFECFDRAIEEVNESKFGLQTGVFTGDLYKSMKAWDELEVGGVIIGDVPSWRVDNMPYGGVKDSGLGREGVRYAIEDMTEKRLFVIREGN